MQHTIARAFGFLLIVPGCWDPTDSDDAAGADASYDDDDDDSSGEASSDGESSEDGNASEGTSSSTGSGTSSTSSTSMTTQGQTSESLSETSTTGGDEGSDTTEGDSGDSIRSAGCDMQAPASERYTINVDGTTREYILRVPDNYDSSRAYPLVFAWHPWGGSANQVAQGGYHGLVGEAGDETILVAADGLDFGGNGQGWGNENGQDLAFMRAMHTRFTGELCVDQSRVFSTGFSFGGMMSFALGCGAPDLVRAIAPMAGNISVAGCESGDQPVAMMGFHGNMDTVVDISGGEAGRDILRERNGCSDSTVPAENNWCDVAGGNLEPCTCVSYEGCDEGYPVIWCEFTGGHMAAPNSGATLWAFFSQF